MASLVSSALERRLTGVSSTTYIFHDITLDVESESGEIIRGLADLFADLSWTSLGPRQGAASLHIRIGRGFGPCDVPTTARLSFDADGLRGLQDGSDFYVTDGASLLLLRPRAGFADARIARNFFEKPAHLQRSFWAFAILKLLRHAEIYSLHAAGLSLGELDLLVVGPSGCGKSTLTLTVIRAGARYLSDDAVLLRSRSDAIEALALRRDLYVDDADRNLHQGLGLAEVRLAATGRPRRRVTLDAIDPDRRLDVCRPGLLLFPRIAARPRSRLIRVESAVALKYLIEQSGPQLFDRETMPGQLATLRELLRQARAFELAAGRDVLEDPETLGRLLVSTQTETSCLVSSSS